MGEPVPVIDVDSHFMEPFDWLQRDFPELAARVPAPDMVEVLADALFGDLMANMPPALRPDPMSLVPESFRPLADMFLQMSPAEVAVAVESADVGALTGSYQAPGARDASARLAYIDELGIDIQFIVPAAIIPYRSALKAGDRPLALEALAACNTWTARTASPHTDRLVPVTLVDLTDLDWALAELARMRELGSRVFQIKGEPVDGRSLAHPDFDRVWSTATDLGMIALFHVGGGRATFAPGWFDNGGDVAAAAMLATTQYHQVPEIALTAMILGGVFERHPKLTVVVAELGISWVPSWLERMDSFFVDDILSWLMTPNYKLPLRPSEYAQRQVRVTPLPLKSQPPAQVIEQVGPDMIVFSSDYPHPEGSKDAVNHHRSTLAGLDQATQDRFFGGSMAEALARADGAIAV